MIMHNPLISIIICTYRRQALLSRCVESIIKNNYANFEIIIIDQEPNRRLQSGLQNIYVHDNRIKYIYGTEIGLSRARNIGIRYAQGEILVFADDDVQVDTNWLQAYLDAFMDDVLRPSLVAGRLAPLWECSKPKWIPPEKEYLLGIYDLESNLRLMPESDLPIGANFAVLRRVIDLIGGFNEEIGYNYARKCSLIGGEDSLFSLKAKNEKFIIAYQPSAMVWHYISTQKQTIAYFLKRNFWDGATLIIVMYLSNQVDRGSVKGIIYWHFRSIVINLFRIFFPKKSSESKYLSALVWMRFLANCANSLGVISVSLKLISVGKLP